MHGSLVSSSLIRETTENVSANLGYVFGQEEETYNIVAAHAYHLFYWSRIVLGRSIDRSASWIELASFKFLCHYHWRDQSHDAESIPNRHDPSPSGYRSCLHCCRPSLPNTILLGLTMNYASTSPSQPTSQFMAFAVESESRVSWIGLNPIWSFGCFDACVSIPRFRLPSITLSIHPSPVDWRFLHCWSWCSCWLGDDL